jgi:hypothetical protein
LGQPTGPVANVGCDAVLSNRQEIQQELADLIKAMPRLLQDNQGTEFWIEFLGLAEAIKEHAPFDYRDRVTARIHQILTYSGVSPPSWWVLATLTPPGHA